MVAHGDRLGLQFAASGNGHDHLSDMFRAVTAAAAFADQRVAFPALRLPASLLLVQRPGRCLEDEVLLDVSLQTLTTILDADLLTIVLDSPMAGAEAPRAVLALAD
ncbi:MAG: hypothetical protein OXS30_00580 [Chloroflexota bacterium]|nr:hypothetical protein [Chloroflexota bacterium]